MKTKPEILELMLALCASVAATTGFGQTIYTWTNNAAFADLATAANWNPNGVPTIRSSSVAGDVMQFDGQTTGPVSAISNTGGQAGSSVGQCSGHIYVHLTANQVSPVDFLTTVGRIRPPRVSDLTVLPLMLVPDLSVL